MKKLFALLLALTLALSLGAMAFADGETAPTPMISVNDNHQYSVYQIFTGDLYEGILSNIKWGENGQGTKGNAVSDEELEALAALLDSADAAIVDKIKTKYANFNGTAVGTVTKSAPLSGIPTGYYILVDEGVLKVNDDQTTTLDPAAEKSIHIVQVVGPTDITSKADVPEVIKKIVEGESKVDTNEASIGDTVTYSITGKMPSNLADYNTYFYKFTDTLTKGLTYNNDLTVTVDGTDATNYFYKNATTYSETDGTTITVSIADILALNNVTKVEGETTKKVFNVTSESTVVVSYTATLNENAVIAGEGNPNKVKLEYSNNPNNSGTPGTTPPDTPPETPPTPVYPTGKTPDSVVTTYTTELTIQKVDENGQKLTGASFKLSGTGSKVIVTTNTEYVEATDGTFWKLADGTYTETSPETENIDQTKYANDGKKYKVKTTTSTTQNATSADNTYNVTGTVGSDGKLTFTGLGAGEYTLTETTTPAGYNTIAPISFTVGFDSTTAKFSTGAEDSVKVGTDNKLYTTIENQSGTVLPETGGIGTTIFYVVGAVLVAGAAIILFAKKRAEE